MQIKTKTKVTLVLNEDEAILLCGALGALTRAGRNPFTNTPLTTKDNQDADKMLTALQNAVPAVYEDERYL